MYASFFVHSFSTFYLTTPHLMLLLLVLRSLIHNLLRWFMSHWTAINLFDSWNQILSWMKNRPNHSNSSESLLPLHTLLPSCIKHPQVAGGNYELKLQYISMLSKFIGYNSEDVYLFISEFHEVFVMIKLQLMLEVTITLNFITFALKIMPRSDYIVCGMNLLQCFWISTVTCIRR